MENLVTFWKNKKIFITGHTGFKGSWLCLWLKQLGANVVGYALNPPTEKNLFEIAHIKNEIISIIGDIRDFQKLSHAMQEAQPEIVIHMAAQALVRKSYIDPIENYSTNVMGTVHVLEAVRQVSSVRAVVNVTSDKCYENREWVWGYRENEAMGGHDPYSSSKACSEIITKAWRNSYFNLQEYANHRVAIASARAGNVIGGGDWATDRLVPDIIRSMIANTSVLIRNPKAIRPWQHVLEPLSGYLLLAQRLFEQGEKFAEAWNFGPRETDTRPVQWIVQRMIHLWGPGTSFELDARSQPHEAHYLKLDCSKAMSQLNWSPRTHLNWALEKTIAWHKAHLNGVDMRAETIAQIKEYMEIVYDN